MKERAKGKMVVCLPKRKWSGWEKFSHAKLAYAGATTEGVGVVHFKRKLAPEVVVKAARSLGLMLSDERHPERRKHLQVRARDGSLVATLVGFNLALLPKHAGARKLSVDFVNALLEK